MAQAPEPDPTITKQLAHLNWHACTMKAEGEQDLARNTRLILNGPYRPLEKLAFLAIYDIPQFVTTEWSSCETANSKINENHV